jgi:threonine dehydrogenase-like Zn-dependent dehydrogenase
MARCGEGHKKTALARGVGPWNSRRIMRGVVLDVSVPRYLLGRGLGPVTDWVLFGGGSGLGLRRDLALPRLPGPAWCRLEVLAAGVCGTDLNTLAFKVSPAMEPFASFPAVLGHEILARVAEVGPSVSRVQVGQRVVVDPVISCVVRGHAEPCPACAAGRPGSCARAGEEGPLVVGGRPLGPGTSVGYHRDLPGGWGEELLAHESQLFAVDEALGDTEAALVEPLAIGVHAVLGAGPEDPDAPVLVIGSGVIALGTVWALRALGHRGPIVAQTKRAAEAEQARSLGASRTVAPGAEAEQALLELGATRHRPLVGPPVYRGAGFAAVFDCVGSRESLDQALRFTAARGRIVLLGCAGILPRIDLSPVWSRELELRGFVQYGAERFEGHALHTFEVTQRLLLRTGAPVGRMVSARYPLERYREALAAARHRGRSGAIKVLLTPR